MIIFNARSKVWRAPVLIRDINDGLRRAALALLVAAGLAHAPALFAQGAGAQSLDALIKAARAEGEVVFYSAPPENVAKRVADAFSAKYGIKTSFTRMAYPQLMQRFGAEAEAGSFPADLFLNAGTVAAPYALEGIKKGWIESISEAGLPVITSGEFPARFNKGPVAVVAIYIHGIAYNTSKVKAGDVPKDWPDILDPKWKGQVMISDPAGLLEGWSLLLDKYGEGFFKQISAGAPRLYSGSAVAATQALGAGEGSLHLPNVMSIVAATKDKGAPIDIMFPSHTTGSEIQVTLVNRSKVKHPNAARLFANYIMTPEGSEVFNRDPGGFSMYDTSKLPKQYEAPKLVPKSRIDQIMKLLGF